MTILNMIGNKFIFRLAAYICLTFSAVSCSDFISAPIESQSVAKVFYALVDSEGETKISVSDDGGMGWQSGDEITLFRSPVAERFGFNGEEGDEKGSFIKTDTSTPDESHPLSTNFAIYPESEQNTFISDGRFSLEIPGRQYYAVNSFGQRANVMAGTTETIDDDLLRFRSVCGFIRLRIYGLDAVKTISLTGNDDEIISGAATLEFQGMKLNMHLTSDDNSDKEISLECTDPVIVGETLEKATEFWLVVPPVTFSKGFSITVTDKFGNEFKKSTSASFSVVRNQAKTMKAFEIKITEKIGTNFLSFSLLTSASKEYSPASISTNMSIGMRRSEDVTKLKAQFTHDGAHVYVNDVEQESGVTEQDFTNPVVYKVVSALGQEKEYTVKVTCSDLPSVYLTTPDGKEITSKTVWKSDCTFKIVSADGDVKDYGSIELKGRGNASWGYPKKPYAIRLASKEKVLGMKKHKRWILIANWSDRTLLRHDVAFEIARSLKSLEWTPSGEYCELYFNGKHRGNYYLCEQIKVDKNRVNIADITDEKESDGLTGGYLMELEAYYDEAFKFKSGTYTLPYMFKDPDEVTTEQFTYMQGYINDLESLLANNVRVLNHEYRDYMDVDTFIDFWFVQELTENVDAGVPRSYYVYKNYDGEGIDSRLKAGPVWDFEYATYLGRKSFIIKNKPYYSRLFLDPEFKARVYEKWIEVNGTLKQHILDYIDERYSEISASAELNCVMWPCNRTANGDEQLPYDQSVTKLKNNFSARYDWFNNEILKMKP